MANNNESIGQTFGRWVTEPIGNGIKDIALSAWDWFVGALPDIVGYGALSTGAFVILSTMAGRGMIKPLSVFSGIAIVAVCILEAN